MKIGNRIKVIYACSYKNKVGVITIIEPNFGRIGTRLDGINCTVWWNLPGTQSLKLLDSQLVFRFME